MGEEESKGMYFDVIEGHPKDEGVARTDVILYCELCKKNLFTINGEGDVVCECSNDESLDEIKEKQQALP